MTKAWQSVDPIYGNIREQLADSAKVDEQCEHMRHHWRSLYHFEAVLNIPGVFCLPILCIRGKQSPRDAYDLSVNS